MNIERYQFASRARYIILIILSSLVCWLFCYYSVLAKDTLTVTADKEAEINKQTGVITLKRNVVIRKDSTGSKLMADTVKLAQDPSADTLMMAEAIGDVKVEYLENNDGPAIGEAVLFCDMARFDRNITTVVLEGSVLLRSSEYRLDAQNVIYNYETGKGKLTALPGKQVTILFKRDTADGESEIKAVANEILVYEKENKLVLQGQVKVKNIIDGSSFESSRADLFFSPKRDIETIIATGQFKMEQPGRRSEADKADLDFLTEEIELTGNAYVKVDDQIEVNSSQIVMHMKVEKGIIKSKDDVPVRMTIPINE